MNDFIGAAIAHVQTGFAIFPLYGVDAETLHCLCGKPDCEHPGKHPMVSDWETNASADEAQILAWWRQWPNANIGVPCGRNGLAVSDLDERNDGFASLRRLEEQLGPLPRTRTVLTGNGEHRYFQVRVPLKSAANVFGAEYPGVDLKSRGGYVVGQGSLHANGRRYTREVDSPDELIMLPDRWIVSLSAARPHFATQGEGQDKLGSGNRNTTLASIAGTMRRRGMSAGAIRSALLEVNKTLCVPALPDAEVDTIARSIGRYEPEVPFTTSTPATDESDNFDLVSFAEIEKRGLVPTAWEFEGVATSNEGPLLMTAAPDRYKSWISMLKTEAIAARKPLFDTFAVRTERPGAIFVNIDAPKEATENRIWRLGPGLSPNAKIASWDHWDLERFKRLLEAHPGWYVSVDCFADIFMPDHRLEQGRAMREFGRGLRKLYENAGCNGVITDHAARQERDDHDNYSGSAQKKASFRSGWTIKWAADPGSDENQPGKVVLRIGCLKPGSAEPFPPFKVECSFDPSGRLVARYLGPADDGSQSVRLDLNNAKIANALADGKWRPSEEIAVACGWQIRRAREHIRMAVAAGVIEWNGKATNGSAYRLGLPK